MLLVWHCCWHCCTLHVWWWLQSITFSMASFGFDPKSLNVATCKSFWYLAYFTGAASACLETFISIDRCLRVAFVNRFSVLTRKWFQNSVIIGLVVSNSIIYLPMLYFYDIQNEIDPETNQTVMGACRSSSSAYYSIQSWIDLMNSTIVPFMIMFVSSIITIRCLIKSRKRSNNNMVASSAGAQLKSINNVDSNLSSNKNLVGLTRATKTREEKEFQFAFISITMNILFFALNVSAAVYNLCSSYLSIDSADSYLLFNITYTIFYCNFSYKFFIHFIINSKFRCEFKKMRIFNLFS